MFAAKVRNFLKFNSIKLLSRRYCENTVNSQANILVQFLGLKSEEAVEYVITNRLKRMQEYRVSAMLKFLKEKNFPEEEILKYPILFRHCNGRTWEHYYLYLEECGCININLKHLLIFLNIICSPIKHLKNCLIIPKNVVPAEELIKHIKYLPTDFFIDDLRDDNLKLSYVHETIMKRFYKSFFECTEDEILTMFRIHRGETKCFKCISENMDIALSLGYTKKRIRCNAYILLKHPACTKEVLEDMPNFLGGDMAKAMKHYPKLIGISKQHILRVYNLIKENNFSDEQILNALNVFTLSYNTVHKRLIGLQKHPEIKILFYNKNILSLIIHYNRSKKRLELLKKNNRKCTGLNTLASDYQTLERDIITEKDIYKSYEIDDFLKDLLKTTDDQVVARFKCHPFYHHVPFLEIKSTYQFLKRCSFRNDQLCLVPQILLYPEEKIKEILEMIYSKEFSSTGVHDCLGYQKLNVMLYLLEKNYHFTGNGIWANKTIPDELD